jgi:hypothetical protein
MHLAYVSIRGAWRCGRAIQDEVEMAGTGANGVQMRGPDAGCRIPEVGSRKSDIDNYAAANESVNPPQLI